MKKLSIGFASILLATITLLTACNGAGGSSSAPAASSANSTDSSSVCSSGDFSASNSRGTKEVDNNASEVNTEEVSNNTSVDTSERGNDQTMTPTETEDVRVDTTKIEPGDFTAGGYAPTTPDSKYKNNGLATWQVDIGLIFDTTQTQDLYNFVKAGYTSVRSVDARIQSRKGGADNPRVACFESYELGKDNALFVERGDDGWVGNTVTVTYDKINCSKELKDILSKPLIADNDGDGVFTDTTKNWDKLLELNEKENVVESLNFADSDTSITYNYRNYCGDVICLGIRGPDVGNCSGYCGIGATEKEAYIAGIDYTLTCEEDPDAFKLISGDELKNYYSFETKWGNSINQGSTQVLVQNGQLMNMQLITKCSDFSAAGVTKTGVLGAGAQYYTGVKPGIYHCTITLKDGKQIPIVIENLPIHYETLLWGCKSQSEMDACVKFVQQSNKMLFGQYVGLDGTNLLNMTIAGPLAAEDKINVADNTKENLSKAVKIFNDFNYYEIDGSRVELKDTEAAGEWWLHFTCISPSADFVWGGSKGTYRALELFQNDPNGDCETASAGMSCILNVMGYTTRYVTNSSHAYIEIKVPAAITKSGKDQWIVMNNGALVAGKPENFRKMITQGHNVHQEVKGFDNYWVRDYPELLE